MGHLATTKPDKALQVILQDPELSDSSKHTYAQRLRAISAKLGHPISELAMQPMTVIPWIKKQYPEVATQKNVVTAVLAALRRMPVMKKQHRQALAIWLRASKELEAQQQARLKANEPSARQKRGYVDFRDVIRVRTSLAKGSRQEKKRKEKTTPFGVNLMRSQVLYRAAQRLRGFFYILTLARPTVPPVASSLRRIPAIAL